MLSDECGHISTGQSSGQSPSDSSASVAALAVLFALALIVIIALIVAVVVLVVMMKRRQTISKCMGSVWSIYTVCSLEDCIWNALTLTHCSFVVCECMPIKCEHI